MTIPAITCLTCVNNPTCYKTHLLNSIYATGYPIKIVPILNSTNHYSAAAALNQALELTCSPLIMVAHQDVALIGVNWFHNLHDIITTLPPEWGVLSPAGIGLQYNQSHIGPNGGSLTLEPVAIGSVWHDPSTLPDPPYWDGAKTTQPIHCGDECLLIIKRDTNLRFDPTYSGYHCYGIDLCLQARAAGYQVFGAHLPIIHVGNYSHSMVGPSRYWSYMRYLHNKWYRKYDHCLMTHGQWVGQELVSYIPMALLDEHNVATIKVRSQSISRVRLSNDLAWGIDHD